MSIVENVVQWYETWDCNRPSLVLRSEMRSIEPTECLGKVVIEFETENALASLAFWNKGDVTITAMRNRDNREFIFDDRQLRKEESISTLLDLYVEQILGLPE
jgi:hypothetical protein